MHDVKSEWMPCEKLAVKASITGRKLPYETIRKLDQFRVWMHHKGYSESNPDRYTSLAKA